MAKARRFGAAVALLFSLTGCTYHWVKPDATPGEYDTTMSACTIEGRQRAPYDPIYTRIPGETTITRDCDNTGRHCVTEKTYSPPYVDVSDGNEFLRGELTDDCMMRHGWVLKRDQ